MDRIKRIAVGSTNPVKIAAVRMVATRAFPGVELSGLNVESGVSEQPWGDAETRQGAFNRARAALAATGSDLGVGLEGGVIETEMGLMTCAWCVVTDADQRVGVGGGVNLLLPPPVAQAVRAGGELGPAMDDLTGLHNTKQAQGAVGILTGGLFDRASAYGQLVAMALAPFVQTEYYQKRPDSRK